MDDPERLYADIAYSFLVDDQVSNVSVIGLHFCIYIGIYARDWSMKDVDGELKELTQLDTMM